MIRGPTSSPRTDTLFPSLSLFRSDSGLGNHPGQYLHAFLKPLSAGIGQIEAINSAGRRRLRIAIAAKGRAQPLPNPLRLPIRHIFGAPKGEMFQKMSETKQIGRASCRERVCQYV